MPSISAHHCIRPVASCARGAVIWRRPASFAAIAALVVIVGSDRAAVAHATDADLGPASADASLEAPAIELPANRRLIERARRRLPAHFALHTSSSFAMLSDLAAHETQAHGRCMERAYEEFLRFARACGLEPRPLEHKLVSVCFQSDEEYRSFAMAEDGPAGASVSGYYSPRSDLVVMHVGQNRATLRGSKPRMVAQAHAQTPVLRFEPELTPSAEETSSPPHHGCSGDSIAKRVHETVHQLTFHTRVMNPAVQYPPWICEGLATAFETESPEQPFGPDVDFAPRREVFQQLLANDDVWRLRHLVSISRVPADGRASARIIYHQSYALVTWLYRHRRDQLRDYLNAMVREPAGAVSPERNLQLFEQSFGDVEVLERQWLDHELDRLP